MLVCAHVIQKPGRNLTQITLPCRDRLNNIVTIMEQKSFKNCVKVKVKGNDVVRKCNFYLQTLSTRVGEVLNWI